MSKVYSDTRKRLLVKIFTWHFIALILTFTVVYIFTGQVTSSIKITLTGIFSGMVLFYFHERIWDRINWGKIKDL